METEVSIALIVGLSTLLGTGFGALVTYFVEKRRQTAEMERLEKSWEHERERQKLAWKKEETKRLLEPMVDLLDRGIDLVNEYAIKKALAQREDNPKQMEQLHEELKQKIKELDVKYGSVLYKSPNRELSNLIMRILLTGAPVKDFNIDEDWRVQVSEAYNRIQQLLTDFE